jgi:light-harvesting complex 1 beta chain
MVDDVRHGDRLGPSTYLTDSEAREFHSLFITSFIAFTIVAIIAHILVWNWRPWIPGPDGYAMNTAPAAVAAATTSSQA